MACLIVVAVTVLVGRPTTAIDLKTEAAVRLVAFIYHMVFLFVTLINNEGVLCASKTCCLQADYLHVSTAHVF